MRIFQWIAECFADQPFVRSAREDREYLSAFKKRPTATVILGIFLILFSYVIGWPVVGALGLLSFYTGKPLILMIGGPLTYGLSHLVFLAGLYFAGKPYAIALARWAIRVAFEKMLPAQAESTSRDYQKHVSPTLPLRRDERNDL